jgi:aquaporin Z
MIYSIGNVSGAHINPAVTLGFAFAGRLSWREVLPYVGSQLTGALVAAAVLRFMFPEHSTLGSTLPGVPVTGAFLMEVLLTFLLMFVILNVSTGHMEKGVMAGVAVGGMVALAALFGGPVSGASMNPARSLGPALVSGQFTDLWIYILAPAIGAMAAFPTCRWIQGDDCCVQEAQSGSVNATR